MGLPQKTISRFWLLLCFIAAGPLLAAPAAPEAPASPVPTIHDQSEAALEPLIDPQVHLGIQQLRTLSESEPNGLLARFDVEYYSIDHGDIQSIQLIWSTPSGFETRIYPKPVEGSVYAARVLPVDEDGFHKLKVLIVIEGSGKVSENLRVIEQQYTLEWPQLILTQDWETELKPSAEAHGMILSGDDFAMLAGGANQHQSEPANAPVLPAIITLILVNGILAGSVLGYRRYGKLLPARITEWLEAVVPAPRREALIAMSGVGSLLHDPPWTDPDLTPSSKKDSSSSSPANPVKSMLDKLSDSSPRLDPDKLDSATLGKKKISKDPLESTQILTDSQANLVGANDPVDDEEKLNLDDLSF